MIIVSLTYGTVVDGDLSLPKPFLNKLEKFISAKINIKLHPTARI